MTSLTTKKRLFNWIKENDLFLIVVYVYKGVEYSDTLHHSEITTDKKTIKSVIKVLPIKGNEVLKPLSGVQAHKLIQRLSDTNINRNKKKSENL